MKTAVRSALVIVICQLAAACASGPAPRPLARGFGADGGVADPYADGKRHLTEGNYELAAQRFGQALAHDGRSLDALNGLGVAYTRLRRFDSAETQFERALQIEPTDAATLNNYGWSLIEQGRLREARAFLALARTHGTDAEAPMIAANLERLGRARPPALVAALEEGSARQASGGPHRLIRVDDNAYHLDTTAEPAQPPAAPRAAPDAPPASITVQQDTAAIGASDGAAPVDAPSYPSVAAPGVGAADVLPAPVKQFSATEPEPAVRIKPRAGDGPIRLWPPSASGSEAGPITAGDEK